VFSFSAASVAIASMRIDKVSLKILSAGAPVDFKDDSPTKQRHPDISSGWTWPIIR
jgi:hypothetical protein